MRCTCCIVVAAVLFTMSCKQEEAPPQQDQPQASPKAPETPPDTILPVAADSAEENALVYWYDSKTRTLHVFKPDELHEMITGGEAKEIVWSPGQVLAQVTPGPGGTPIQAQVKSPSTINEGPDAVYGSVGDMRRLSSYRERHTFRADKSGCLTDLSVAPIARPPGTVAYRTSRRYHEYLQGPGQVQAAEWVENTARYTYYPVEDSLACNSHSTNHDRMPRWVIAVHDWP